uniref:Rab-GAP TBC domain-containing protein n=1 Tax=Meloidogyne hapla TaxID=6305 RepID=A0A1I8BHN6_MELHA
DDPKIYSNEIDCTKKEDSEKVVKMFKENSNNKQMHKINYLTIKYLIKNSPEMRENFEDDDNSSKDRLYKLIGNELGNLEIEYPLCFPIGLSFFEIS